MSNALSLIRSLIIYSLCLPLAIFLGYILAMPMDETSFIIVISALCLPLVPVLLKWHHLLLFACWNTSVALFFLPGRPNLWLVMAGVSFVMAILQHILNRDLRFIRVSSITWPLLFLALVIVLTAQLTGGFGMRGMGSELIGGKRYLLLLGAIIGYFGMTFFSIPRERAVAYVALYFFGTLTWVVGSLAPYVPPDFYRIFLLFPVENLAGMYAGSDSTEAVMRLGGVTFAATATFQFLLARHGIGEIFAFSEPWHFMPVRLRGGFGFNQPWRFLMFAGMVWLSLLGGYRATAIILALTLLLQFHLERLWRSPLLIVFVFVGVLATAIVLPMLHRMPITVQRSLSFLPVEVDPEARAAAEASSEWRIRIWKAVWPMIPQYLLVGKGYSINPNELMMASDSKAQGRAGTTEAEGVILAGDYHNGPLSLIIHLGIFGVIAFLWFLWAAYRVLINNFRFGDPALHQINTFLLAYFLARIVFFFFVFGAFHGELAIFTGMVGLSVSLNGGVSKPSPAPVEKPALTPLRLARAAR